jgi:LppP/LprE lipoprotein
MQGRNRETRRAVNTMGLVMRRRVVGALLVAALGAGTGTALGGCGSQTKTVSAAASPASAETTSSSTTTTASTQTTSTASTQTTSSTPASEAGGTSAPAETTRTATEPAFTHQEGSSEGLEQAVGTLRSHGYTAANTAQYHSNQTLRVLVGTRSGSSDGYGQQAFFFVDGRYIGTDTKEPSANVNVVSQSDTEVTLSYQLYREGDPLSSPSGGTATVRFQLDDGKLTALDPIPPASSASAAGRL